MTTSVTFTNVATTVSAAPATGSIGAGKTLVFALTPSQAVQVSAGAGNAVPYLQLSNGAQAGYTGQGANGDLLFAYQVAVGQDAPALQVGGLALNGATITASGTASLFAAQASYPTGNGPVGVAAADLNGDGKLDLVTGSRNGTTISVLPGDGLGGFGAPTTYAAGNGPTGIAAADLEGDGNTDLVTTNYDSGTVSVLLGNGLGGFGAQATYAVGGNPFDVAAADFDGDGKLDLAVANHAGTTVSVLLGDGLGGFGAQTTYAAGNGPTGIAAADLNGDGNTDLVTTNYNSGTVSVLLGNGLGGFGAQATYAAGTRPVGIAVADFDADGKLDLVTSDIMGSTVSVRLGDGLGGFGAQATYGVGNAAADVAVADLDGDGKLDLIASSLSGGTVSVRLGDGLGGFGAQTTYATGSNPYGIASADLDGDGKSDIIASNYGSNTVSVLLYAPTTPASFDAASAASVASAPGHDTGVAIDTTAPGVTGVTATPSNAVLGVGGTVRITVSLSEAVTLDATRATALPTLALSSGGTATYAGPTTGRVSSLEFDYTVRPGENAASLSGVSVSLHGATAADAAGNALLPPTALPQPPTSLVVDTIAPVVTAALARDTGVSPSDGITSDPTLAGTAEANRVVTISDGAAVLGTTTADAQGNWRYTPTTLANRMSHALTASQADAAGNVGSAAVQVTKLAAVRNDVGGDGRGDLVWQHASGGASVWAMQGGAVAAYLDFANPGASWRLVGTGDLDGDGRADLVWQNGDGTPSAWIVGAGGTTVAAYAQLSNPGAGWRLVGSGDLDADGKADLLWQNGNGAVSAWLMDGTAVRGYADFGNPGRAWHLVGSGDLNGDGRADLAWQNDSGAVSAWLMGGSSGAPGVGAYANFGNPGADWALNALGDVNGDGRDDLVFQNRDGTPSAWLMGQDGTAVAGYPVLGNPGADWKLAGTADANGDGRADLVWQNASGQPSLWLMGAGGTAVDSYSTFDNPGASWAVRQG